MNPQKIINNCIGKNGKLIGQGTFICKVCGKPYKSYILNSGEWNLLPPEYKKHTICLSCYKKIKKHTPKVII